MYLPNTKPIEKTPFWHYIVFVAGMLLLGFIFSYLDTVPIIDILLGAFLIIGFLDMFWFSSIREKKRNNLIFDNRVLGFIDGLHFSEVVRFGCADFEMRRYVEDQLSKAHKLPGNQFLIEYTTASGQCYCTHTGLHGDHILFAILCIAQYAKERNNAELVSWCESRMLLAHKSSCGIGDW